MISEKKPSLESDNRLIKSKDRVRNLGEVFTPDFLVEQMLDQFPEDAWGKDKNWLEPTCGNGQFILGILRRKLSKGFKLLEALDTTFGTDIMSDNIIECHMRIYSDIVMPYIKKAKMPKTTWNNLRLKVVCIVETNIKPTKDALLEDYSKWKRFTNRPKSQQDKMIKKIESIFNLIDTDQTIVSTDKVDNRLYKELLVLKRGKNVP